MLLLYVITVLPKTILLWSLVFLRRLYQCWCFRCTVAVKDILNTHTPGYTTVMSQYSFLHVTYSCTWIHHSYVTVLLLTRHVLMHLDTPQLRHSTPSYTSRTHAPGYTTVTSQYSFLHVTCVDISGYSYTIRTAASKKWRHKKLFCFFLSIRDHIR